MIQIKNSKIVFIFIVLWVGMVVINSYFKDDLLYEIRLIINTLGFASMLLLIAPRLGIYEYKKNEDLN